MGYSYLINYNPWIIGFELLSFFFWHRNCIKKNNIQFINKLPALHFSNKSSTFYFKITIFKCDMFIQVTIFILCSYTNSTIYFAANSCLCWKYILINRLAK